MFSCFVRFLVKKIDINSEKRIEYDDRPQRGHPKRAELLDVHVNTGAQSINTESLSKHENKTKQKQSKQDKLKRKAKTDKIPIKHVQL